MAQQGAGDRAGCEYTESPLATLNASCTGAVERGREGEGPICTGRANTAFRLRNSLALAVARQRESWPVWTPMMTGLKVWGREENAGKRGNGAAVSKADPSQPNKCTHVCISMCLVFI